MERKGRSYQAILLGNAGVGKTTFFNHLNDNASPNVDSDVCTKMYTFGEETVTFNIWDTGGHESYRSITPSYYRRANLVICMYSVAKVPHSIYDLNRWIENAKTHAVNATIVLIANDPNEEGSRDSDRETKEGTSEDFQKEYDIRSHFKISVRSKQQVEETFRAIAKTFHEEFRTRGSIDNKNDRIQVTAAISKQNKQWCSSC